MATIAQPILVSQTVLYDGRRFRYYSHRVWQVFLGTHAYWVGILPENVPAEVRAMVKEIPDA